MRKIYDISIPLASDTLVWPGDPPVSFQSLCSISGGAPCNVTTISLGSHSGTHVDAPLHFVADGVSVDRLPLETLIGSCLVVEQYGKPVIEADDLKELDLGRNLRILFKTGNSLFWKEGMKCFEQGFTSLGKSGAAWLIDRGVRLVGIDYLSIEQFASCGNEVHRMLLENGVIILESINLTDVPPGSYELICLPLRLTGCDGAPARVVLREI